MSARTRLVIASNRLPFTVQSHSGKVELQPTTGGLASALGGVHKRFDNVWVGWPGDCSSLNDAELAELDIRLRKERVVPVSLSSAELEAYYDGICNSVLWPVFHYLIDRLPVALPEFESYRAVNERFAATVAAQYRRGDMLWIHDYHLLLAPAMIRTRIPDAQIGFFLHTPFPSADVFRVLPWRRELLDGVLGATLIGFQTRRDAGNFADTVRTLTEYLVDERTIMADGREVRFGSYPIGIDPVRMQSGSRASLSGPALEPRTVNGGCRLFVGVDRLDYTKGLLRRLTAFEHLLAENPGLRGRVELLQIAVPSRGHVPSYISFKQDLDALVDRINARFETPVWRPVRYLLRSVSPVQLSALYRAADVMLVTSLRDGMNLVAKEFVSSRDDDDGVLILSELAGASEELPEALLVNPYSIEQMAEAMARALEMGRNERRRRMKALREHVSHRTVDVWVSRFTADLAQAPDRRAPIEPLVAALETTVARGGEISLVLPYEGALVAASESAAPDPELLELLGGLATRSGIRVNIITAFDHDLMDQWLDLVPGVIWAEHGLWRRERDGHRWRRTQWVSLDWMADVRQCLDDFTARTPGAFVEERAAALVWHFGRAARGPGRAQARILSALLRDASNALDFMVLESESALEVRPAGLTVGRTLQRLIETDARTRVVFFGAAGDSAEAREALRPSDIFVNTATPAVAGGISLPDIRSIRDVLREVVASLAPAKPAEFPFHARLRPGRRDAASSARAM